MTSEERKRAFAVEKYAAGVGIRLKTAVISALIFDIAFIAIIFTVSFISGDQSYIAGNFSPMFIMLVNFLIYGFTSAPTIRTMNKNSNIETSYIRSACPNCSVDINDLLSVLPLKKKDVCNFNAISFEIISAVNTFAIILVNIISIITNNMGANTFFNLIGLYIFISMIFWTIEYFCFVFNTRNSPWGAFFGGACMAAFMLISLGLTDGSGTIEEISEFNDRLHIFGAFSGISGIIIEIIFLAFIIFICEIRFKNKNSISWNVK